MKKIIQNLIGESIVTLAGNKYKLTDMIGSGAQGVVYEEQTGRYVIKLYYPSAAKVIDKDKLNRMYFIKNVVLPDHFVKIIDIIEEPYIGYVMTKVVGHVPLNTYLIPSKNKSFSEWYNNGMGLRERLFLGYVIAKSFANLEGKNLSYCDISGNNILVKINKTVSVKMIDIDNIYIAGKSNANVLGTPRYIAPEVVNGLRNPDVLSDNYSLAVILFELLRIGHPYISDEVLAGSPEDEEQALAGKYDYVNDSNSENMLPADVVFTSQLKKLFYRCFVDGKNNRMARPSAREFEFALLDASNKLIKCNNCGAWHYPRKNDENQYVCPWCDHNSKISAKLNFYDVLIEKDDYMLNDRTEKIIENKITNTFILKKGKNQIKGFYILKYDDLSENSSLSSNYLTIARNAEGYWAYNEFSKDGISIRSSNNSESVELHYKKYHKLGNGDYIYFNMNININIGGKEYGFMKVARFLEERQ